MKLGAKRLASVPQMQEEQQRPVLYGPVLGEPGPVTLLAQELAVARLGQQVRAELLA